MLKTPIRQGLRRGERETKAQRELDQKRKVLLEHALKNPPKDKEWRKLATLSRIIGANYETTTRLLIELGARGSEKVKDVWAPLSEKPLRSGHSKEADRDA